MLVEESFNKSQRNRSKKRLESSYISLVKKPSLELKTAYIPDHSTAYLTHGLRLPISNIERKVYRKAERQKRLKSNQLLATLKNVFSIPSPTDVNTFLIKHPDLVALVLESANQIRRFFDSEELSLEIVIDPEISDSEELFVYVLTSLPAKDALEKLNEFDDQWFLDQLDRTEGLFNFNLRFV